MKANKPWISVVIPVRNEGVRLKEAILSFTNGRSKLFPIEFIIVDDCSTDGCCNGIEKLLNYETTCVIINVLRLDTWSGIPFSRNAGANLASAAILVITDANVKACHAWDIPIFRDIKPNRVLCATIADINSDWKGYGCVLDLPSMGIKWLKNPSIFFQYTPITPSTGTVIAKQLFLKIGGFDTAMPIYGAAEPEFSVRLWLYGAEIKNVPKLIFYHRFRPDEERGPFLNLINVIQVKNYIRFALLYLPQNEIREGLNYWSNRNNLTFLKAVNQLDQYEIFRRRQFLKTNLLHDFNWFKKKINLHFK